MFRTQGLDVQISVKTLAGCGPSEERNEHTRNGISCKECTTCYTTRGEKAKGKNVVILKIYMQEVMQDSFIAADERR
jgi:hypothetical protein